MAAKFTHGDSTAVLRSTKQADKVAPVQRSSLAGLPGYIKTGQDKSSNSLAASSGAGPKREGPIGKKGGSHGDWQSHSKANGSMDKNYKATSTGPAGRIAKSSGTSLKGASNKGGSEGEGHRGRMESLRGRARTSWEH